jgi:NADP-dependent 3-hydroxy acid dehydrogenase YdfG
MKKNIVITGVSSGIGRDALRLLHYKGYHIYGSVRKEADAKSLTEAYPKGFTPLIFDVQDQEAVTKAAKIILREYLEESSTSVLFLDYSTLLSTGFIQFQNTPWKA